MDVGVSYASSPLIDSLCIPLFRNSLIEWWKYVGTEFYAMLDFLVWIKLPWQGKSCWAESIDGGLCLVCWAVGTNDWCDARVLDYGWLAWTDSLPKAMLSLEDGCVFYADCFMEC